MRIKPYRSYEYEEQINYVLVKSLVLTAAILKTNVFWKVAPSRLVEDHRRFRSAYGLHYQDNTVLMLETI